jgi:hypothetical protein
MCKTWKYHKDRQQPQNVAITNITDWNAIFRHQLIQAKPRVWTGWVQAHDTFIIFISHIHKFKKLFGTPTTCMSNTVDKFMEYTLVTKTT